MEFRRAVAAEYAGICDLAAANHKSRLSAAERLQGFLSATFALQQIADMAGDLGIMVAVDHARVVGFVCASRWDWQGQPPIVQSMIAAFDDLRIQGHPLALEKLFIYGPVCIERAYRGRGLLRGLYRGLRAEMAGRYELGAAFVAQDNPRSLSAHRDGLGMRAVGRFSHEGRRHHILLFTVDPRA